MVTAGLVGTAPRCAVPELLVKSKRALLITGESSGLQGAVRDAAVRHHDWPEALALRFGLRRHSAVDAEKRESGPRIDTHARETSPHDFGVCSMSLELY